MRHFTNIARFVSLGLAFAVLLLLSGCGGGASTSGGGGSGGSGGTGGGGGGNNTPLHIATLSPTSIMPTNALASLLIFGQGFRGAQCYIDGVPMSSTLSQGTLYVQVPSSLFMQVGVHQVTVHDGDGTVSNTLPFTVYIPQNGPQVMEAVPAFDVGGGASNPNFITAADVNGDGLSDVIMPATGQGGSGGYGIAIFYGQTDGNLSLDGWPDLYVANDAGPNYLYRNKRDGTFEETGMLAGAALSGDDCSRVRWVLTGETIAATAGSGYA